MTASTVDVKNPTMNKQGRLFVHYTNEHRFKSTKRDLCRVDEDTSRSTSDFHARLVVGNQKRSDARDEVNRK